MEGLAAVAAAMQLVDYGLSMADSISALVERIRTAPKRFEQYAQQVDRLVLTAREIEQNPDLQTRVVCCYLTATLAEAKAAQHILDHFLVDSRKRRYWGVISGKSQRKILEHLDNLHHSVAELSLCIMSINMTQSKESAMKVVEVGGAVERTHMELVHVSNTLISNSRQSTLTLEGEDTMADSKCDSGAGHTFEDIIIEDDFMPSLGNVTSGTGCSMNGPSHEYKGVQVRRTFGLHLGNTGSRARHRFKGLRMSNNQGTLMGDVDTLATKQKVIHLTQEAMKSMPDSEEDSGVSFDPTSTKSRTTLPE